MVKLLSPSEEAFITLWPGEAKGKGTWVLEPRGNCSHRRGAPSRTCAIWWRSAATRETKARRAGRGERPDPWIFQLCLALVKPIWQSENSEAQGCSSSMPGSEAGSRAGKYGQIGGGAGYAWDRGAEAAQWGRTCTFPKEES